MSDFLNESFSTGTVFRLEIFVQQNKFVGMQKKRFEHIDMSREKALLEIWYYPVFDAEWKRNLSYVCLNSSSVDALIEIFVGEVKLALRENHEFEDRGNSTLTTHFCFSDYQCSDSNYNVQKSLKKSFCKSLNISWGTLFEVIKRQLTEKSGSENGEEPMFLKSRRSSEMSEFWCTKQAKIFFSTKPFTRNTVNFLIDTFIGGTKSVLQENLDLSVEINQYRKHFLDFPDFRDLLRRELNYFFNILQSVRVP